MIEKQQNNSAGLYADHNDSDSRPRISGKRCRVAVIMTSFNRREKTLACLTALQNGFGLEDVDLHGVLVDDGSRDGTGEAIARTFPWMHIISADGSLFWCRGMHKAFSVALDGDFDYFLWLNDDTILYSDALARLLECEKTVRQNGTPGSIIVGSTVDETSGKLTYGGERRASVLRPLTMVKVIPGEHAQPCDTMNGNIVLIPAATARMVGNLDPGFEHAMGDTDYALRAGRLGVAIWVAPGVHGSCGHNPVTGTFSDRSLSLSKRWRLMLDRKGLPWRSWLILTRRHAGHLWSLYFVWPYAKLVITGLIGTRLR